MPHQTIPSAIREGLDILHALRDRGVVITLREDGKPAVSPRRLVDEDVLVTLCEHRDRVLLAVGFEAAGVERGEL